MVNGTIQTYSEIILSAFNGHRITAIHLLHIIWTGREEPLGLQLVAALASMTNNRACGSCRNLKYLKGPRFDTPKMDWFYTTAIMETAHIGFSYTTCKVMHKGLPCIIYGMLASGLVSPSQYENIS